MYTIPSFYAHTINGMLIVVAVFLAIAYSSQIRKLDIYKIIKLLLVLSIAIGIHGLSHLGLENVYGFNPLKQLASMMK